jgi:ketosteroid isomerase-like protein
MTTSQSNSNKEKALVLLNAVTESARDNMTAVCHEDFMWKLVAKSLGVEPLAGGKAIEFLSSLADSRFKPGTMKTEILKSLEGDDDVVMEVKVEGTALNGKHYENIYVMWFEFRDGLISELREHTDTKYAADVFELATSHD